MLVSNCVNCCRRRYYYFVNLTIAFRKTRWIFTACLATWYFYRATGLSYDVITYLIGFYILQLLVNYFTPQGLEECESAEHSFGQTLGEELVGDETQMGEEDEVLIFDNNEIIEPRFSDNDKPLVSSMNQHQIWQRISFAFFMGIICTLFKSIEIDVFWPMLMIYFIVLVCYTIQKIFKKMKKYQYSLSDFKKKNNPNSHELSYELRQTFQIEL